ncbi:hypothetical protein [Neisseria dentiae]|uniref:hypothetical protein n=1 Tax=Neisseria dentiae TaxID=194197 RepID=UPI0035A0461B
MKTMKIILSVLFAVALAACAAPQPQPQPQRQLQAYRYWGKEGVSRQAAKDQLGFCRHEVRASELPREEAAKLVGYCMRSKGYVVMTGYR